MELIRTIYSVVSSMMNGVVFIALSSLFIYMGYSIGSNVLNHNNMTSEKDPVYVLSYDAYSDHTRGIYAGAEKCVRIYNEDFQLINSSGASRCSVITNVNEVVHAAHEGWRAVNFGNNSIVYFIVALGFYYLMSNASVRAGAITGVNTKIFEGVRISSIAFLWTLLSAVIFIPMFLQYNYIAKVESNAVYNLYVTHGYIDSNGCVTSASYMPFSEVGDKKCY